jgi:hypothetical protein
MFRSLSIFLALLCAPTLLDATLQWDALAYNLQAKAGDTKTVATYTFKNTGKNPVDIARVESSCGCTTAELTKRHYNPGEGGTIKVVFTYGDRKGDQHKTVIVSEEDNGARNVYPLELFVKIPESVVVEPRVVYWDINEAATSRTVRVKLAVGFNGKPVRARLYSEHSDFVVGDVKPVSSGVYEFTLTPVDTSEKQTEAGELTVEVPGGESMAILFYASVRP